MVQKRYGRGSDDRLAPSKTMAMSIRERTRERLVADYRAEHLTAAAAARGGYVDAVISPNETRSRLAFGLDALGEPARYQGSPSRADSKSPFPAVMVTVATRRGCRSAIRLEG